MVVGACTGMDCCRGCAAAAAAAAAVEAALVLLTCRCLAAAAIDLPWLQCFDCAAAALLQSRLFRARQRRLVAAGAHLLPHALRRPVGGECHREADEAAAVWQMHGQLAVGSLPALLDAVHA